MTTRVYWSDRHQLWKAEIQVKGVIKRLGYFGTRQEALHAYNTAALWFYGKKAILLS